MTAAIIIALIVAAVVMEVNGSANTIVIIAALVGLIGLQNVRTSQITNRIEEQTNGKTTARFDALDRRIDRVETLLDRIIRRLDSGDRKFDEQATDITEARAEIADMRAQIDQLVSCETKPETS